MKLHNLTMKNMIDFPVDTNDIEGLSKYIIKHLKPNEIIQVSQLGENIISDLLQKDISRLKQSGLDIGTQENKYTHFIYPFSRPINKVKKLYLRRNF